MADTEPWWCTECTKCKQLAKTHPAVPGDEKNPPAVGGQMRCEYCRTMLFPVTDHPIRTEKPKVRRPDANSPTGYTD